MSIIVTCAAALFIAWIVLNSELESLWVLLLFAGVIAAGFYLL
jgi:hypothetical protein